MSKKDKDATLLSEVTHSFMPVPLPPDDPRFKHRVENTYHIEPAAGQRFQYWRACELAERRLTEALHGLQYDAEQARSLTVSIADNIRKDVEDMGVPRYKLSVHVLVCEKMDQGLAIGCRSLWDDTKDNFATATYESQTLLAVAAVFATYCE